MRLEVVLVLRFLLVVLISLQVLPMNCVVVHLLELHLAVQLDLLQAALHDLGLLVVQQDVELHREMEF